MPFEVKAAYGLVLDLIYLQGGKLPDDAGYISGVLGVSKRKWASLRKALIDADKLQVGNGYLTNYRAIIVLENTRKFQDKQSENARGRNKNNGLEKPPLSHTEPEPYNTPPNPPKGGRRVGLPDETKRILGIVR